jgi:hypothetical protein
MLSCATPGADLEAKLNQISLFVEKQKFEQKNKLNLFYFQEKYNLELDYNS